MEFNVKKGDLFECKVPCLVIGIFEGKFKTDSVKQLDLRLEGAVGRITRDGEFRGEFKETLLLHTAGRLPADRILLVGLGEEKKIGLEKLRQAAAVAVNTLREKRIVRLATNLAQIKIGSSRAGERVQALCEGLVLADYQFERYRTEKREKLPPALEEVVLIAAESRDVKEIQEAAENAAAICQGSFFARDLVNEPGNIKTPAYLAERARSMAEDLGLKCTLMDRAQLEEEGFGAMLGVARGSVCEPVLIVLEYQGDNNGGRPLALVGKGVTFDAGGISLKPAEKMDEMKMDMAGGATVLGALMAAALLKLPVNLVGIVPAVENMPSGSAIRPGDILTSLSGKTIEVLNTDAEGRLILADALTYAKRFQPRIVIDLATLTGACVIALGHHAAAVLGNHDGLVQQLIKAGQRSGEKLWQLPLWEDYAGQLKSDIADVKNIGGRPAGTITAAAFLQHFADDFTWAHLDIAGTAWEEKGRPGVPKGATGFGVRLLIEYLRQSK